MLLEDESRKRALGLWIAESCGAETVLIHDVHQLDGGAIQQNWLINAHFETNGQSIYKSLVLRTDSAATIAESRSRQQEFQIMEFAFDSGISVPQPLGFCDDTRILGQTFSVVEKVDGVGFGPKVVKLVTKWGNGDAIVKRLAEELARIHMLDPKQTGLDCIDTEQRHHGEYELTGLQQWLDQQNIYRPALDWGFRWAIRHLPNQSDATFLHRDFRTGNFLVNEDGLSAVLDWEFSGYGDPMSDIGWFCAECWRFSRPDLAAGGLADRAVFNQAYETASGRKINADSVYFWELVAHLRWSVIALQQGHRHLSGMEPSLSMAITSRIVDQLELIILRMTKPSGKQQGSETQSFRPEPSPPVLQVDHTPHQSTGADLLNIAKASMADTVIPKLGDDSRLNGLMVNNAISIVGREIVFADSKTQAEQVLLQSGNWTDQNELSYSIRNGDLDGDINLWRKLLKLAAIRSEIFKPGFASEEELGSLVGESTD